MRNVLIWLVTTCALANPSFVVAAEPPADAAAHPDVQVACTRAAPGVLAAAIARDAPRFARSLDAVAAAPEQAAPAEGWIKRHPALFGAIVGAGAGALAAGTMENEWSCSGGDEDCLFHGGARVAVGAGMGAGIGAAIGALVGMGHD